MTGDGHHLGAKPLRQSQRVSDPVLLRLAEPRGSRGLDVDGRPGGPHRIRYTPAMAHDGFAVRLLADAHQHAVAGRPRSRNGVAAHVIEHLLVDALGRAAQREFPECGQVARREIMSKRPLRLARDIDLTFLQSLDQILWREVEHLDVVRAIDDRVRHRLAHPDAGDLGDDVVQTFHMLDIQRRVDVDPGRQQLFHILIPLGMPALRRVGVGQFVHQRQLRSARQDGVEIHLARSTVPCIRFCGGG